MAGAMLGTAKGLEGRRVKPDSNTSTREPEVADIDLDNTEREFSHQPAPEWCRTPRIDWRTLVSENSQFPVTVDCWAEYFWAGVDNGINRWMVENGDLPIDRALLFAILIQDVRAIATVESHGDPAAIGTVYEVGIMQLLPSSFPWLGRQEMGDPLVNIFNGCWYYTAIWLSTYQEMILSEKNMEVVDVHAVSRVTAARYNGGPSVSIDEAFWREVNHDYVRKFEAALQGYLR